jgi:hypothetical protein
MVISGAQLYSSSRLKRYGKPDSLFTIPHSSLICLEAKWQERISDWVLQILVFFHSVVQRAGHITLLLVI